MRPREVAAAVLALAILAVATTAGFGATTERAIVPLLTENFGVAHQAAYDIHNIIRKALHVPAYGLLASLIYWALRARARRTLKTIALSLAVAMMDESIQALTPSRSASVLDVLLDMVGVVIVVAVAARIQCARERT